MDSTQTDLKHKHIKDESLLEVLVFIKHFAELSHRSSLSLSSRVSCSDSDIEGSLHQPKSEDRYFEQFVFVEHLH